MIISIKKITSQNRPIFKIFFLFIVLTFVVAGAPSIKSTDESALHILSTSDTFLLKSTILLPGDLIEYVLHFNTLLETDEFKISIGDLIEVKIIDNNGISFEQMVRPDGKISLAYIGDFFVSGKSPKKIREELIKEYENFLSDPEIVVVVKNRGGKSGDLFSIRQASNGISTSRVRYDGVLVIPGAGEVMAAGRSVQLVKQDIEQRLLISGVFVSCDILVREADGCAISVFGEVQKPGIYLMKYQYSIYDAISAAGGLKDGARMRAYVIRKSGLELTMEAINLKRIKDSHTAPMLSPRDVVYIEKTGLAKAGIIARQIGELLLFRGFSSGVTIDPIQLFDNK